MKTLSVLKKIINFYFYFLLIGFLALTIVAPILFKLEKFNTLHFIDYYDISSLGFGSFMIMISVSAVLYYYFLRAIYLLKNSLNDLSKGNYFSEVVISNFKEMGKAFLVCGIGFPLLEFFLRLFLISDIKLGINNALILFSIVGLFFMFLSEAFAKARKAQQENDLTI